MSKVQWYTENQQDLIMKLASLDLVDIVFDDNGEMCVRCSEEQRARIEMLADLDDDSFIEFFHIEP